MLTRYYLNALDVQLNLLHANNIHGIGINCYITLQLQKRLLAENENLQMKLLESKSEVRTLNDLINKIQSDKKLLSDHVQTLSAKGMISIYR